MQCIFIYVYFKVYSTGFNETYLQITVQIIFILAYKAELILRLDQNFSVSNLFCFTLVEDYGSNISPNITLFESVINQ